MKRVLVPLDGSPFAELALPVSIHVAEKHDAALAIVVVNEPPPSVPPDVHAPAPVAAVANPGALAAAAQERRASDERYLRSIAARASAEMGREVEAVLLTGSPARTLISHIREAQEPRDLVVMTTHGRGGLERLWLGSVADAVIRHVTVPVLLVRSRSSSAAAPSPPALPFHRVLVALDGSAASEDAIEPALAVCGKTAVQYGLMSVIQPITALAEASLSLPPPIATDADATAAIERYLRGVADRLGARGLAVRVLPVVHTNPARAILEKMEEVDADLLAVTTHGRGGWRRAVLGSTADKVIRGTERSVLVWRHADGS